MGTYLNYLSNFSETSQIPRLSSQMPHLAHPPVSAPTAPAPVLIALPPLTTPLPQTDHAPKSVNLLFLIRLPFRLPYPCLLSPYSALLSFLTQSLQKRIADISFLLPLFCCQSRTALPPSLATVGSPSPSAPNVRSTDIGLIPPCPSLIPHE